MSRTKRRPEIEALDELRSAMVDLRDIVRRLCASTPSIDPAFRSVDRALQRAKQAINDAQDEQPG